MSETYKTYFITRTSSYSGIEHTRSMNLTEEQHQEIQPWLQGGKGVRLIQHVVPHLSADDREFILTGLTGDEWRDLFCSEEVQP